MFDLKEVEIELNSQDPVEIASALMTIGKQHLKQFQDAVVSLLDHSDPEVRREALAAVCFYWALPEFKETAQKRMLEEEEPFNRERALVSWTSYFRGSKNQDVLQQLKEILEDKGQPFRLRTEALDRYLFVRDGRGLGLQMYDTLYFAEDQESFDRAVLLSPYSH